jgi:hypothetical protein
VKERSRKFFLTILEFAEDARATTFGKIVLALPLHARGSFHSQHQCHLVNINITSDMENITEQQVNEGSPAYSRKHNQSAGHYLYASGPQNIIGQYQHDDDEPH